MKKIHAICLLSAITLAGCATAPKPMYYWNDYSTSLYNYKKNPGDDTYASHKACLTKIIDDSNQNNTRVPPGIYAELGFMNMKEGRNDDAVNLFNLEMQKYPESSTFISMLIEKAKSNNK